MAMAGTREAHLERQGVDPATLLACAHSTLAAGLGLAAAHDGTRAFIQHEPANRAEKADIAKRDDEIDLTQAAQKREELNAEYRTG